MVRFFVVEHAHPGSSPKFIIGLIFLIYFNIFGDILSGVGNVDVNSEVLVVTVSISKFAGSQG